MIKNYVFASLIAGLLTAGSQLSVLSAEENDKETVKGRSW